MEREIHKRRIQSFAKYSYAITLPVHWIKQNNLVRKKSPKGKESENGNNDQSVSIYENPDGSLSIYPTKLKNIKKERVYLFELDDLLKKNPNFIKEKSIQMILISYYMNGATGLKIISKSTIPREFIEQIENILDRLLLNWNLNRDSKYNLIIKNVHTETPENIIQERIPQYLKESFSLLLWMIDDILEAIESKDFEKLSGIQQLDMKIDRYYFFIVRQIRTIFENSQISRPLHFNHKKLIDLRLLSKFIEDVGDSLKDIAEIITKLHHFLNDIEINTFLIEYFTALQGAYSDLQKQLKLSVEQRESTVGMNPKVMGLIQQSRKIGKKLEERWQEVAPKVLLISDKYTFIEYYEGARLIKSLEDIFKKIFDFTNLFF